MKFLDLFAGIGGFRLGMEQAGHECVGYVEWDKYARKSYEAIHDTEGEFTAHDITTITDDDIRLLGERGIDIICGGFPCQAFSVAGKRGGFADTRGTLFFEIARIAKQIKPRILLLENVKGLLSHEQGRTFGTILNTLDELGYDCEWQVLNSKNFGVPQNRERVFIVGHLRGSSGREVFPFKREDGSPTGLTVKSVGNINPSGNGMNGNVYDSKGLSPTLTTNKGEGNKVVEYDRKTGVGKELETAHTPNSSDWRGLNRNQKQNAVVVPVLTPDRAEKRQNGRRFKENGDPSFTLTAQDKHGVMLTKGDVLQRSQSGVHKLENYYGTLRAGASTTEFGVHDGIRIRRLTPKECFRLQGFPDSAFDKAAEVNSNSQLYKQAGNSVTVNVIHEIAKRL